MRSPTTWDLIQMRSPTTWDLIQMRSPTIWDRHPNEKPHYLRPNPNEKPHYLRPTSTWEAPLLDDLRNQQQSKRGLSSKIGQYRVDLISRIDFFCQCHINIYQTQTYNTVSLPFTMPHAISISVYVIAQNITDTTRVKPQRAKRFEVRQFTF